MSPARAGSGHLNGPSIIPSLRDYFGAHTYRPENRQGRGVVRESSGRSSNPSPRRSTALHLIADEIWTGFCRTGDWFACDHEGVVPDLVTMAKGIAGGLPLAAITGPETAEATS